MKKVLFICLIPFGLFLVWLGIVAAIFLFSRPQATHGDTIDRAGNPNRAIIIIDLYNFMTCGNSGIVNFLVDQKRADLVIETSNEAIDYLRKAGGSTVFIYNAFEKWTPKSIVIPEIPVKGSFNAQIDARLHKITGDPEFNKPSQDAFSNPDLQKYLGRCKIGTLFLTGTMAGGCVYMTAWGAINRGYTVYIIDEALYFSDPTKKEELFLKYENIGAKVIKVKDLPSILKDGTFMRPPCF